MNKETINRRRSDKTIYTLVIESPRGDIYHDVLAIDKNISNQWNFAKSYVKQVYGKGFLLCDMYLYL